MGSPRSASPIVSFAWTPGLVVEPHDVLLEEPRFGAFHGTDLEMILRTRGLDTIIASGTATNVCRETPAREAVVGDFRVLFLSDGTAATGMGDAMAAESQQATLATLRAVCTQVLTVDEATQKTGRAQHPAVA